MFANLIAAAVVALAAPATHASNTAPMTGNGGGVIITNVAMGEIDPNGIIPTTNGVQGAGVDNVDIATPIALLSAGQNYAFTMAFHDLSYSGSCTETVTFTQIQNGKKVRLMRFTILPQDCEAGNVYLAYAETGKFPNSPGSVTMSVTVYYGNQKATMKVPLVLQ
jgi:hypothetical protein